MKNRNKITPFDRSPIVKGKIPGSAKFEVSNIDENLIDALDKHRLRYRKNFVYYTDTVGGTRPCIDYPTYIEWTARGYYVDLWCCTASMTKPMVVYSLKYNTEKAKKILEDHIPFKGAAFCKQMLLKLSSEYEKVLLPKFNITLISFDYPRNIKSQMNRIDLLKNALDSSGTIFNQVLIDNKVSIQQYKSICSVINKKQLLNKIDKMT